MIYNDPYLTRRKMVTLTLYQQQLTTWYDNYTWAIIDGVKYDKPQVLEVKAGTAVDCVITTYGPATPKGHLNGERVDLTKGEDDLYHYVYKADKNAKICFASESFPGGVSSWFNITEET